MQLAAPQPRRHKVLMSFRYWNAWDVVFFDTDRMRTALPRRARFNSDEALIEFAQRAGEIKMSQYAKVELVGGRADPRYRRFVILRHPFQFLGQPRVFG